MLRHLFKSWPKKGVELTIFGTSWLIEDELTKTRERVDLKGDELTTERVEHGTKWPDLVREATLCFEARVNVKQ
jgi:hypothetical protein